MTDDRNIFNVLFAFAAKFVPQRLSVWSFNQHSAPRQQEQGHDHSKLGEQGLFPGFLGSEGGTAAGQSNSQLRQRCSVTRAGTTATLGAQPLSA